MTYDDQPFPSVDPEKEALFAAAAAEYARYRPGLPDEAARLLADTLSELPYPMLLDLGTGTGQIPLAFLAATPGAVLAIMGDGSLRTHPPDRARARRELIQHRLGATRRAGAVRNYTEPGGRFEEGLAASAWSDVTQHRIPITRAWTPQSVPGHLRTTSFAGADLFGDDHAVLEADARALLTTQAGERPLVENAVFTVLLAQRGGGAR
ncbi:methyltransferase [Streptomyces sp. NPDC091280]|uniref:methyltransferase n=1 Tax=Streptomyces sp. NPDC091280 TaxID=3365984 RepID=UPI0037FE90F5